MKGAMIELLNILRPIFSGAKDVDFTARFKGISTDTRTIEPGNVFMAIRGGNFDGHNYVDTAAEKGAVCAVVDRPVDSALPQIIVSSVETAYGLIARAHRTACRTNVAAVVGSNGKTTATQMLAAVLRREFSEERVLATSGNFNNTVGVPRTLLGLKKKHDCAVVECGMNHRGEMAQLADWTLPDVVLMTNAQRDHQEFLGSVEETARENGLAFVALPRGKGAAGLHGAVFPADDPCAPFWQDLALATGADAVTYASVPGISADVTARRDGEEIVIETRDGTVIRTTLAIAGDHNVHNAAGVAAAALYMGVNPETVACALAEFSALPGRGARTRSKSGNLLVVDDAYNANPDSVRASMRMLAAESAPRTFILGDMAEIGQNSEAVHAEVGAYAREAGIENFWAVGKESRAAADAYGEGAHWFASRDDLIAALPALSGTAVVKASHCMGLDRVVEVLKAQ